MVTCIGFLVNVQDLIFGTQKMFYTLPAANTLPEGTL